jgi:predicted transport protein
MSDIRLFRLDQGKATAVDGSASHLEKPLQTLIETNLEPLLGIRFVASEYPTGKTHAGRIDTLGLDENHCPVILEYKRSSGENVINQGLFYLDWLMDHQAEFKLLVMEQFGKEAATAIDWSAPRLICIAADFTKYDGHAVQQINRNIELIRYRRFGKDLLLLELANAVSAAGSTENPKPVGKTTKTTTTDKTVAEWLADLPPNIAKIFGELEAYLQSLGDDVQRKDLKLYIAFKRLRNFATVVFQAKMLRVYLHLNPDHQPKDEGLLRDVRSIGHWGTGDLELMIHSLADLEKAKPYLEAAYKGESA